MGKQSGKSEVQFFVASSVVKIPACAYLQTVSGNLTYRMRFTILNIIILICFYGCKSDKGNSNPKSVEISQIQSKENLKIDSISPRIIYVKYGKFCGECGTNCTQMYHHFLIGNTTTFWTDKTDSYFSKTGLICETKMNRESEKLSFDLINNIPDSILKSKTLINNYGCPDCDDGCGLYFEFKLDDENSKPIIYKMPWDLRNTSGQVNELAEIIKKTIVNLKEYR